MSNNRDNGPELDYYELRRRHEEYKSRARMVQEDAQPEAAEPPRERAKPRGPKPQAPAPEPVEEEIPVADEPSAPADPLAQYVEDDEDALPADEDYADEAAPADNPNPFDSFIRFFHGVKDNLAARREARDAELENMDDLSEEELAALAADEDDALDFDEISPAPERKSPPQPIQPRMTEPQSDAAEALDIEDPAPVSRRARRHAQPETDIEGAPIAEDYEGDFDEEDFDEEYLDGEEDAPRGGFKKFLSLFVTRIDDEDAEDGMQDAEDAAPTPRKSKRRDAEDADDAFYNEFIRSVHGESKGGQNMDEMNKPVSDNAQQMAEGLETSGMSRRERRERAMRLAAEEAARKAEEEARRAAELPPEPLFVDDVEAPAPVSIEPEAPAPVSIEPEAPAMPVVEEPTREYKPVNVRDVQEAAASGLFDLPEEAVSAPADEDGGADEDGDDAADGKPRRGLFGKKRDRYDDDDEDEDDEDYDDEDEEDDEDEDDDRPARRGLFGRRKNRADEDDEDEEDDDYDDDEDDDYDDDEDEDDDYDEYDDEYDDDEYDDDDAPRSIGYHVLGVLKSIAIIVVILALLVVGMNYLYANGTPNLVPALHDMMGDSAAFRLLFPKYTGEPAQALPEPTPAAEVTQAPTQLPEPEATAVIPNLDGGAEAAPVVETAPVVQSAPVAAADPAQAAPAADAQPAVGAVG